MILYDFFNTVLIERVSNGYVVSFDDQHGGETAAVFYTFAAAAAFIADGMCFDDNTGAEG